MARYTIHRQEPGPSLKNERWYVHDDCGDIIGDLSENQAEQVRKMMDRAFDHGFNQCGDSIRTIIRGAQKSEPTGS